MSTYTAKHRRYYERHRAEVLARAREKYEMPEIKEAKRQQNRIYRADNLERCQAKERQYARTHRDQRALTNRRWRLPRQAELTKRQTAWWRRRYNEDPLFRLEMGIRNRLRSAIKQKRVKPHGTLEQLVGCSSEVFQTHIEAQFADEMTWDNYGVWHLDHRRPCASFDLTDPLQIAACFHYTNLQPLWGHDNLRKGKREEVTCQPHRE